MTHLHLVQRVERSPLAEETRRASAWPAVLAIVCLVVFTGLFATLVLDPGLGR